MTFRLTKRGHFHGISLGLLALADYLAGGSKRRRRALSLWDEDMRNRQQHETDTGHLPSGGGMTGGQRRAEIRALAEQLGLAPLSAPRTHQILLTAAPAAGLTAVKVGAAWRVASGFAHGRYWPNLRASQPRAVIPGGDGHTVAFVLDEDQHRPLAEYRALVFLARADHLPRTGTAMGDVLRLVQTLAPRTPTATLCGAGYGSG
ncbi:hypothetical protein [Streptomyces cinerochromogenes]|uniref:hypothetical protein n=1 Tax=Streptomyces cinerochromogenes TaxID=66422 RepID=UPI00166FE692|nr:hypothetical protein [Streptomyces cinerochromogenes]GGS94564.1 hypothetical protein GCM10010206_66520 [Streptomyces cinerochromogenes]